MTISLGFVVVAWLITGSINPPIPFASIEACIAARDLTRASENRFSDSERHVYCVKTGAAK